MTKAAGTLFKRLGRIGHRTQLVELLAEAARWSNMPAGEQLRFEAMLKQMVGREPRKEPLPKAPLALPATGASGVALGKERFDERRRTVVAQNKHR